MLAGDRPLSALLPRAGSPLQALPRGMSPITFDARSYSLSLGDQGPFTSSLLRLRYSSLTQPASVYDVNMQTGEPSCVLGGETCAVQSSHACSMFCCYALFLCRKTCAEAAAACTGLRSQQIPEQPAVCGEHCGGASAHQHSLQRRCDLLPCPVNCSVQQKHMISTLSLRLLLLLWPTDLVALDGSDPLLLEAYGAYGSSFDPVFSNSRLSLLDRGFVLAIAHVRGGGERGAYWHQDGKLLQKNHTFDDVIASAEHLIQASVCS